MANDSGYSQQDPADSASDWAARQFQINQTLARVRTMVLVEVTEIKDGAGAIAAPGTVTVKPLVKIIDGQGNVTSHGTVFNIPVFRLGGGKNAVICDPVVGDIGWMAVADRDSSVVKQQKAESQPGSRRKFNLADGVYMGSLFGAAPEQYITFNSNGTEWADKHGNKLTSSSTGWLFTGVVTLNGNLQLGGSIVNGSGGTYAGTIETSGEVKAGAIGLKAHHHTAQGATAPTTIAQP